MVMLMSGADRDCYRVVTTLQYFRKCLRCAGGARCGPARAEHFIAHQEASRESGEPVPGVPDITTRP